MKAVPLLVVLVIAGCADIEPGTSTAVSALSGVNTTCQWIPGKNCYGKPNDGNNIWPADMGIRSVQVFLRSGPDRLRHTESTFLAFVIWNTDTVGRIFRIDVGPAGADFHEKLGNITATRTFSNLDTSTTSTGTAAGGPVNPPHPNVDEALVFEPPYLDMIRRQAAIMDRVTTEFLRTPAAGVDEVVKQ